MKKVIAGKLYDTEKAKAIASCEYGGGRLDMYEETLYRKRTGEYFLAGSGGAMTKYSRQTESGNRGHGEGIIPLTYEDAREWAEKEMTAEAYRAEFGTVDDEETVHLHISLPADAADRIRKAAAAAGLSVSALIASKF